MHRKKVNTKFQNSAFFRKTDLFISGEGGYHTYRIPALIVSKKETILAFCEGRKYGRGDAGKIDIVLKRSFDYGHTWGNMRTIVADGDMTCGNPSPVVDQSDGTVLLLFCKNPGDMHEGLIREGKAPRTVWLTRSIDDGTTWSKPVEITEQVKDPSWTWYATGPGHAIQLSNMRVVIPCDHVVSKNFNEQDPGYSHIIYSDDHGENWEIGGIVDEGTNESTIVQTVDGSLYINCRNYKGITRRISAWSQDNGDTFSNSTLEESLIEPMCQASIVRLTSEDRYNKNRILFSNPASIKRERLTIKVSYDECRSWSIPKLLNKGPSAYSDLTIAPDMSICCLYERGENHPYEKLTLAQFTVEWLTDGRDSLV